MGTDAVFKGQSAVSDTIYHQMLLDKIQYMRENQCIVWLIQFLSKKEQNSHNQQWFLCWTLQEAEPIVETTVWTTTGECARVCIIHMIMYIYMNNQKSILIAAVLFLQAMFVPLPRLRASLESKPELCPCSSGSQITLPKPNYTPIWLNSKWAFFPEITSPVNLV